jgi:hypothetical protein
MKAQLIYDLSKKTAFVSGTKMHEYFQRLTGEPSPSGKKEMDFEALKELVEEDKVLFGLFLGLATFGKNKEVKSFLEACNYMIGWG